MPNPALPPDGPDAQSPPKTSSLVRLLPLGGIALAAIAGIVFLGDSLSILQGLAIFAICFCVALEYVWTQRLSAKAA